MAVDATGAAYVAGYEESVDFPTVDSLPVDCSNDGFVTKLNPGGNSLIYSTCLGGNWEDSVYDLALDATGSAYVTGYTFSPDFPLHNAVQPYFLGSNLGVDKHAFVTKPQCDSVDDPQVLENTPAAVFNVHLCTPASVDGTIDYATSDGTAVAGTNYVTTSGTLQIPAAAHDAFVEVPLIDDGIPNEMKSFTLTLSNPVNVSLGKTQGSATIIDADRLFYDDFSDGVVNWDNADARDSAAAGSPH